MKKLYTILLSTFIYCIASGQTDILQMEFKALGCPGCAGLIEKQFKDIPGIQSFDVNMKENIITVRIPADHKITLEEANKRVTSAKYKLANAHILTHDGNYQVLDQDTKNLEVKVFKLSDSCDAVCQSKVIDQLSSNKSLALFNINSSKKQLYVLQQMSTDQTVFVDRVLSQSGK